MKTKFVISTSAFFSLVLLIGLLHSNNSANAQARPAKKHTIAAAGDSVWVIVNHVKADKRTEFEHFVHVTFWGEAKKLSPSLQAAFHQTRVLYPTHQEKDGTYSYVFIMDPVIPGGNYDIAALLKKEYGDRKGAEYYETFLGTIVGDETEYRLVQSKD